MANTVKISSCELINADCLEFIQTLPENSVDLIVTDPPYFKVKPEGWDNQWKGDDDYPGKHPCEKPAEMLQQIISASSRPGDLIADFFMGSGSTVKAALALGRRAIGVELETERFEQTVREVQDLVSQNG